MNLLSFTHIVFSLSDKALGIRRISFAFGVSVRDFSHSLKIGAGGRYMESKYLMSRVIRRASCESHWLLFEEEPIVSREMSCSSRAVGLEDEWKQRPRGRHALWRCWGRVHCLLVVLAFLPSAGHQCNNNSQKMLAVAVKKELLGSCTDVKKKATEERNIVFISSTGLDESQHF